MSGSEDPAEVLSEVNEAGKSENEMRKWTIKLIAFKCNYFMNPQV